MKQVKECIKMSSSNSKPINPARMFHQNWIATFGGPVIAIFITLIYVPDTHAQIGKLEVGDRVRITAPIVDQKKIEGTVTEVDKSVLVLSVKDSSFYISESLILRLETSTGRKRVFGRGVVIGAVTGTILSGMANSLVNNACGVGEDCVLANRSGEAFLTGAAIGLIVGAAIGGAAGFFIKIDRWERVPFGITMGTEPVRSDFNQRTMSPTISFRFSLSE